MRGARNVYFCVREIFMFSKSNVVWSVKFGRNLQKNLDKIVKNAKKMQKCKNSLEIQRDRSNFIDNCL